MHLHPPDLLAFVDTRPASPTPTSLADLVMDAVRDACARLGVEHARVRVEVPQLTVLVDPAQFTRVLYNLIVNGAQAMRQPGEIVVRAFQYEDRIGIEVIDSGTGLSPAARARLFEPFYSTKTSGVGLGLAFVKRVVVRHHGEVRLEPAPSGGTIAIIELPALPDVARPISRPALGWATRRRAS
jgi:signal transduction histidine kinase